MRKCVFGLVNHLPESLRSVIILSDISEFSQREIAEILGITVENVKIRLHRARKKLKALLEEHCVFEVDERNVLTCQPETPSGYNLFHEAVRLLGSLPRTLVLSLLVSNSKSYQKANPSYPTAINQVIHGL